MSQYTDKDIQIVTQLAYMNFDNDMVETNKTIGEILSDPTNGRKIKEAFMKKFSDETTGQNASRKKAAEDLFAELSNPNSKYYNWKVVDVRDKNSPSYTSPITGGDTGFFALAIKTGENNIVVGFRGSESINKKQVMSDWTIADLGLLDSTLTTQQADATQYMRDLYSSEKYKNYNYVTAGHSLGGNLAEHALLTAPKGMNVVNGYSFDGPGNSDEYLKANADLIAARGNKLIHYQFDKNKYRVQTGEIVDVLAIEKRNRIRLLGFKLDTKEWE